MSVAKISLHTSKHKLKHTLVDNSWQWQCAGPLEPICNDYSNRMVSIDDWIHWEYSGVFCSACKQIFVWFWASYCSENNPTTIHAHFGTHGLFLTLYCTDCTAWNHDKRDGGFIWMWWSCTASIRSSDTNNSRQWPNLLTTGKRNDADLIAFGTVSK